MFPFSLFLWGLRGIIIRCVRTLFSSFPNFINLINLYMFILLYPDPIYMYILKLFLSSCTIFLKWVWVNMWTKLNCREENKNLWMTNLWWRTTNAHWTHEKVIASKQFVDAKISFKLNNHVTAWKEKNQFKLTLFKKNALHSRKKQCSLQFKEGRPDR